MLCGTKAYVTHDVYFVYVVHAFITIKLNSLV